MDGKECIVLDYSDTSLLAHWIRDEIREIAPRTYLGKVYWSKKRLIDFALEFPGSVGLTKSWRPWLTFPKPLRARRRRLIPTPAGPCRGPIPVRSSSMG